MCDPEHIRDRLDDHLDGRLDDHLLEKIQRHPLIKEATAAGIPVLIHNSGQTLWEQNGSIGFIGEDPYQMGFKAGQIQAEGGVKHGLCFKYL